MSLTLLSFLFFKIYLFLVVSGLRCGTQDILVGCVQGLVSTGSAAHGLRRPVACGILDTWPGIKPASSASEGGFVTTAPAGKSLLLCFLTGSYSSIHLSVYAWASFLPLRSRVKERFEGRPLWTDVMIPRPGWRRGLEAVKEGKGTKGARESRVPKPQGSSASC